MATNAWNNAGVVMNAASLAGPIIRLGLYARFAKSFDEDFNICQIELDNICWRLSAWAEAHEDEPIPVEARLQLNQIKSAIKDARKRSAQYETEHGDEVAPTLEVGDYADLSASARALHELIQKNVNAGPPPAASSVGRVLWVLYRHNHLKSMLNTVSNNIKFLEDMFPGKDKKLATEHAKLAKILQSEATDAERTLFRHATEGSEASGGPRTDTYSIPYAKGQNNNFGRIIDPGSKGEGPNLNLKFGEFREIGSHVGTHSK